MPSGRTATTPSRLSQPEDDGGGEGDGGEEDGWAPVIAGGDASPVFEAAEHDLHAAAASVSALVVPDRLVAGPPTWDAGLDAFGLQSVPEPVGIIAAVTEQPLRFWHLVQQGRRAGIIADLARGHEEAERAAVGIADGVQLGVHPAFGAADQAAETPF